MTTAKVAGVEVDTRHWIGGRRVASAGTFTDLSPIDERPLAEISRGGEEEIPAAVRAAAGAFISWKERSPYGRALTLRSIADAMEARVEDLAQVETLDNTVYAPEGWHRHG
jgi:aminomuconate-semialdehyde/2-hydroxymuconate-6-semialdehyde dehydrogenase